MLFIVRGIILCVTKNCYQLKHDTMLKDLIDVEMLKCTNVGFIDEIGILLRIVCLGCVQNFF